ncbi:TonB-dependent receptor [Pedobacter gandavensis]|uniref:TonB-dependent receptor n=1 Tax=Pedobacter gandavensis TaxID=2679963 RepID=UPI002931D3F7|nr:TonB-dependent receptor [Pedobacter gandavensis]
MKLIIILMSIGILHVSASGYAQRITLSEKNASLEKIINKIRTQSGYDFLGNTKLIRSAKPISINVKGSTIEEVLQICFAGQDLTYALNSNIVVIRKKAETTSLSGFTVAVAAIDVRGRVIDETGLPLGGASVKLKSGAKAVGTDAAGNFVLKGVERGAILVVSYLGYLPKEVKATENLGDIRLDQDAKVLGDVLINVAYGTSKKSAYTGAVATVDAKELEKKPVTNLLSALAGAAPGVQVNAGSGQPGSGPDIRIRGFGSINSSNSPLYIVDGIQYDGNIGNLNADDIENISILKDAASSALYGSSAANGVILITTKKGRANKEQLTVRALQGFTSRGVPEYDRVNAYEYYPLAWQAFRNSLVYPVSATAVPMPIDAANTLASNEIKNLLMNNPFNVADNSIVGTNGLLNPNAQLKYADDLDWLEGLKRTGSRSDYSMAVSGGSEKSDYYVSLGYLNEKGYIIRSDYNRFNGRINVNSKPLSWLKTGMNISGNITKSNQADADGSASFVNPFNFSRGMGPIYPVYAHDPVSGDYLRDSKGDKIYDTGGLQGVLGIPNRPSGASPGRHILEETLLNQTQIKRNVLGARTYAEVTFLKDFKFTTNLGVDVTNYFFNDYQNKIVGDGAPNGRARNTSTTTTSYTLEQLLNYNKKVDRHTFGVLLGHNNYDYDYKYLTGARTGQILDGNVELGNFATTTDLDSYIDDYKKEAYFARMNYDFDSKYFFSASFRTDASSKWNDGTRWGKFYAIGGAWVASQEDFMKNIEWINYLKVRSSYGSLGNDGLSSLYPSRSFYALGYNNGPEPGVLFANLADPVLTWETNTQIDLAVEFGLFNNRLRGTFELFDRRSTDLLFKVPLSLSSGIGIEDGDPFGSSISRNLGNMSNKGIEIQIGGDIVKTTDFNWDLNVNWTLVRNKITKMPEVQPTIIDGTKQLAVGVSRYEYWLRQFAGVDPKDGASLYQMNTTANHLPADLRTIDGQTYTINANNALFAYSGNAIPRFDGSFTNTFRYKQLTLSVQMNYGVGGKSYDSNYQSLMSYSSYGSALHVDALKSWKEIGDPSGIPRLDVGRSTMNNATSSRFLIDASYLDLRSVNLSYAVPQMWVKATGLNKLNVFATGENLALFSKRKGLDPRQNFSGVNSNAYTPSRIVSLGLSATF